ncbi:MAG: AMP-binding protein [Pseudomonadales bacterium]|nr:AMP-binding protein [Pseudomonadales bacterium]
MNSYYHRGGETHLLGVTIADHFARITERFPQQPAVVSIPQQRQLSYLQFSDAIDQVAAGLHAMGFDRGDRIGVLSTNNIEWLLIQMATARIGVILVNINPAYRIKELAYALQRSELQGLFAIPSFRSSQYADMLQQLLPELKTATGGQLDNKEFPFLRNVFLFDPQNPEQTNKPAAGFISWQELLQSGSQTSIDQLNQLTARLDIDDPINIQYTSGTTGFPKAVLLTHHNILNNAYFAARAMQFNEHDRLCVPVPFYHCFGMVLANLLCVSVGACNIIACEHFDAKAVLHAIDQEKATAVHGVPTMFIAQLEHPKFLEYDLSSLRTGIMAGAPCPPALMTRVIEQMHCEDILIGYGETEASPLTHLTERQDSFERRFTTVGRNLPHQEVKVVDSKKGHTLSIGEIGEICFRGHHIMKGYYNDPDETSKAIDHSGWLHSGDLGTMDEQGYVKITGRLKEMIIRGGENIYPAEIEDVLFNHPKVAQVGVFGIPDDFFGEEIMAWIQPHSDVTLDEQELRSYCEDKLAHFKTPKYIWFVDQFPMTVTGKIQKFRMREIAVEKMAQQAKQ